MYAFKADNKTITIGEITKSKKIVTHEKALKAAYKFMTMKAYSIQTYRKTLSLIERALRKSQ